MSGVAEVLLTLDIRCSRMCMPDEADAPTSAALTCAEEEEEEEVVGGFAGGCCGTCSVEMRRRRMRRSPAEDTPIS